MNSRFHNIDNSWKEKLNPSQIEAIENVYGPLLVVAGAGSGKTRVLTYRYAHLVSKYDIDIDSILAITFTKKAAEEMQERIVGLLSMDDQPIWVTTFHSACAKILRRHSSKIGFKNSFSIYDTQDSNRLVSNCLKELDMDIKQYPPKRIRSQISNWKNLMKLPGEIVEEADSFYETKIAEVYSKYEQKLILSNAFDFDDLLVKTVDLFKTDPKTLKFWSNKFNFVMVDEYQDTNFAQYKIIELLAKEHKNICVVGDSDQSIYAFRGADIRNIEEFDKDFPNAKVVTLDRNYRSTQSILDTANSVISCNSNRKPKNLWTDLKEGADVQSIKFNNEADEVRWILDEIKILLKKNPDERIAIFYRMNSQSRLFQEALTQQKIRFNVIGDVKFYERKEIKDIIAYLTLISNPDNEVAFERVINVPKRGIGAATIEKLKHESAELGIPLSQIIYKLDDIKSLSDRVQKQLATFHNVLLEIKTNSLGGPVTAINSMLETTEYEEVLKQEIDYDSRAENIESLLTGAHDFESGFNQDDHAMESPYSLLTAYLDSLSLFSATDDLEDVSKVILMTFHNAKGLEFPTVFMTGMEENIFPHELSMQEVDEERRLCYVGMTRAEKRLYLTHSWARSNYGGTYYNPPSRFLEEANEFLSYIDKTDYAKHDKESSLGKRAVIGGTATHKMYGAGKVIEVEGNEITVDFGSEHGIKHFDIEWAPIKFE